MLGVVNNVPVPKDIPPVNAAYQLIVPADTVAPNVTGPAPQVEPGVVLAIVEVVLTVAVTSNLAELSQPLIVWLA